MRPTGLHELERRQGDLVEADSKPVRALLRNLRLWRQRLRRTPGRRSIDRAPLGGELEIEELHVVLSGATPSLLSEMTELTNRSHAGDQFIDVPSDRGRTAVAASDSDDASVLVVGAVAGKAFTISRWERERL